MLTRNELVAYLAELLNIDRFDDYAPNGLQVEGRHTINKIVGGVTASQALIDAARQCEADAVLVHHGFFWKGEDPCVVGIKRRRISTLLQAGINLLAYHLPLDAHEQFGNNIQLGRRLDISVQGHFGGASALGLYGELKNALTATELSQKINTVLHRPPLHIAANDQPLRSIAWCTGAAQSYFESAVALGVDAFITGEASEQCAHIARETGVDFFAAGHHATERFGVQALGEHLAGQFGVAFEYIDIDNPI